MEDRLSEVLEEQYVSKRRSREAESVPSLERITTIRVEIPSLTYGDGKSLLEGIDMEANRGEIVGLIGKSGRGKSTLIRTRSNPLSSRELYEKAFYSEQTGRLTTKS